MSVGLAHKPRYWAGVLEEDEEHKTSASAPSASLPDWPGRYSWVRVVWLRVIQRAMFDYILWKKSKSLVKRRESDSARKWLFEESLRDYSFSNVCKLFGFPIEALRTRARGLTVKDVKKMEHIDRQREIDGPKKLTAVVDLYSEDERLLRRRLLELGDNGDAS